MTNEGSCEPKAEKALDRSLIFHYTKDSALHLLIIHENPFLERSLLRVGSGDNCTLFYSLGLNFLGYVLPATSHNFEHLTNVEIHSFFFQVAMSPLFPESLVLGSLSSIEKSSFCFYFAGTPHFRIPLTPQSSSPPILLSDLSMTLSPALTAPL